LHEIVYDDRNVIDDPKNPNIFLEKGIIKYKPDTEPSIGWIKPKCGITDPVTVDCIYVNAPDISLSDGDQYNETSETVIHNVTTETEIFFSNAKHGKP